MRDGESGGLNVTALVLAGGAALLSLIVLFSSYYTVGQGERGVITHYGAVVGLSEPGLHFKMPFVTGVTDISIQPQIVSFGTKSSPDNGDDADKLIAYSFDQQPASLKFSVNWQVTDPIQFYSLYGDSDTATGRIINPRVLEIVKNVLGRFEAANAIQQRAAVNQQIAQTLEKAFPNQPFRITSFQMENIGYSGKYEKAVEDRMEATVRQQQALADKAKRITNADAAAYEVKANADATAHQVEVNGTAEADAIRAKGAALRDNPGIPALIQAQAAMTAATRWNGDLPKTMVPGGAVPFMNVAPGH
jgi:regulator of protease activity HflC (stomatin/prohibitin superfamily)